MFIVNVSCVSKDSIPFSFCLFSQALTLRLLTSLEGFVCVCVCVALSNNIATNDS